MNMFLPDGAVREVHPQAQPVVLPATGSGASAAVTLKIDAVLELGGLVIVVGWSSGQVELDLLADDEPVHGRRLAVPRPDVARHLGRERGDELGFVLAVHGVQAAMFELAVRAGGGSPPRQWPLAVARVESLAHRMPAGLVDVVPELLRCLETGSAAWRQLIPHVQPGPGNGSPVRGHLDQVLASDVSGWAMVSGWVLGEVPGRIWLETSSGEVASLDGAARYPRPDLAGHAWEPDPAAHGRAGFTLCMGGAVIGQHVRLKALVGGAAVVLGEAGVGELPTDPGAASRLLFRRAVNVPDFVASVAAMDRNVLEPLIAQRAQSWDHATVRLDRLGALAASPRASVVIPLYGRYDFVEHQLMEFAGDPWLLEHAELIYVLDDPDIVAGFTGSAPGLASLYGVPLTWVWGGVNRGFSGANNLGAAHARGDALVFLNSDAFPIRPGWARELVEVLDARADIGAVGPRLLFADGSIQHAGMSFRRRDDLGIWVNHHPLMGLDPHLDPARELTLVPAVTGACLAMRRSDLQTVGGWDTGYLIGDFEDSDLCLKLRSIGLSPAYLPTVELVHLERQSFSMTGSDDYRMRVVIYNALRHERMWGPMLRELGHERGGDV